MQATDEAQLIRRAKKGDTSAVSELYRAHVQAIYRYVSYRVGDDRIAEDLTADTFLKAIEGLEGYQYRGVPFRAWLYRIAHARVVDHHRAQERQRIQPLDTETKSSDADLEGDVAFRLRLEKLSSLLPRLTDEQQDVLILRFVEEYNIEQTASLMGKTQGAIKSLQHRALRSLARIFEEEFGLPE